MSLDDMQAWVTSNFPSGKWENPQRTNWLISSPFREDKHPSFSIDIDKRCAYDRATNEKFKLSEFCQKLGLNEPDFHKEGSSYQRQDYTTPATVNPNALIASDRWKKAQPAADDFPYLLRKGVPSYGLRSDTDRTMGRVLLVPAYDSEGRLMGVERISTEGQKQHLGEKKNTFFLIGEPRPGEQVYVAEGFATACSINAITAQPVAVTFSAFNLGNVARILKEKGFHTAICLDSGGSEVTGFRNITMPDGTPDKADWNDLLLKHGAEEARSIFRKQEANSPACTDSKDERATFQIKKMNARELYSTPLVAQTWAIDQMIPQGLSVIASPPKTGKSYFVLQSAFAVARGEKFLGYQTTKGKVLLISLEDTFNRLQKRIVQVCHDTSKIPDNLDMTVEFPRLDSEGLACLEKEIKENGYSLVILDTWGKTKPNGQAKRSENVYETDVRLVSEVKKLADKYGISILLVHHLKKGGGASKDWLESLSGSMGLSATVDGLLALERDRGSDIGILKRSGRDLEDDEDIGLNWLAPCWEFNGSAVQMKLSATKRKILDCIEKSNEPVSPTYIATDIQTNASTVRWHLMKMVQERLVTVTTDSKYMIARKEEDSDEEKDNEITNSANTTNSTNSANTANSTNVGNIKGVTNSQTNSLRDSYTKDLGQSVGSVGTVGHIEENSSLSGLSPESEQLTVDSFFKTQEYSEAIAQNWIDHEAPLEARELYQEKYQNMINNKLSEQTAIRLATQRTWEHFHQKEVA